LNRQKHSLINRQSLLRPTIEIFSVNLKINDSYHISDIGLQDKPAYLEHLQEKQIYLQTLAIPYPYTPADADWWINHNIEATKKQDGRSVNWAIRRSSDDYLVGGIGFHDHQIGKNHRAELGYWLAKSLWNKGIMTEAVKKATEYGVKELGLKKITAHVFAFNAGSAKVLEKCGYQCEGYLRNHFKKDGKILDCKLYAFIVSDFKS
jgi:[ribosomal protein S5]-alanine N-acetyltransferase